MSKIFERMVHRRLEHQVKHKNWFPHFHFGFKGGWSVVDAVSIVSTDIFQAFGCGESVVEVCVDIKGAFNSVLPTFISEKLRCLDLSSGILNFISYMTTRSESRIFADGSGARTCGVGVPQGGVLSPILFNIYTSRLIDIFPLGVRYATYVDDLFLYVISIAKCQFSVFTRSKGKLSDLVLPVEGHDLPCLGEIKLLKIKLLQSAASVS